MTDKLRDTLRYKYEQGCTYEELLLSARQVEGEKTEQTDTVLDSSTKTKAKASVAQQVRKQPDIEKLAQADRCTQGEVA